MKNEEKKEQNPSTSAEDVSADEEAIAEIEQEMGGCGCNGCSCGNK